MAAILIVKKYRKKIIYMYTPIMHGTQQNFTQTSIIIYQ